MSDIITISDLNFGFEDDAKGRVPLLKDLNLKIKRGTFVAIVGPSGCGKTTLIRLIAGLLKPQKGKVELDIQQKDHKLKTAFMFQDARLLPWRRVLDNILFAFEALSLPKADACTYAKRNLEMVGLLDHADKFPHQLSGGQRQRVALARALSAGAEILLMDEPFSALDAYTRQDLQDDLLGIWAETGKTILFITHDMREAEYLADRILVLGKNGTIEKDRLVKSKRPRKR